MKNYFFFFLTILHSFLFIAPVQAQESDVGLYNPLAGFSSNSDESAVSFFQGFAGQIIVRLIMILTVLSLIPIVIGGIYMTSSSGNQDMVAKGKASLTWGVIGLILGLSSFAIYNFVLGLVIR